MARWTETEVAEMRRLYGDGLCHADVAYMLGRSLKATQFKSWSLGIRSLVPVGRPSDWGEEDIGELARLCAAGRRYREIATKMGRTYSAVAQKAHALGVNPGKAA